MLLRFWQKVSVGDGCWQWISAVATNGYGVFRYAGKTHRAHRIAWALCGKDVPQGHELCHHCDNRLCVRPSHLFIGTRSDNMLDCYAKERHRRISLPGSLHPNALLTEEQVARIRTAVKGGVKPLAIEFDISVQHAYQLRSRKSLWHHIPEEPT